MHPWVICHVIHPTTENSFSKAPPDARRGVCESTSKQHLSSESPLECRTPSLARKTQGHYLVFQILSKIHISNTWLPIRLIKRQQTAFSEFQKSTKIWGRGFPLFSREFPRFSREFPLTFFLKHFFCSQHQICGFRLNWGLKAAILAE